jgi:hypothetical protein
MNVQGGFLIPRHTCWAVTLNFLARLSFHGPKILILKPVNILLGRKYLFTVLLNLTVRRFKGPTNLILKAR